MLVSVLYIAVLELIDVYTIGEVSFATARIQCLLLYELRIFCVTFIGVASPLPASLALCVAISQVLYVDQLSQMFSVCSKRAIHLYEGDSVLSRVPILSVPYSVPRCQPWTLDYNPQPSVAVS